MNLTKMLSFRPDDILVPNGSDKVRNPHYDVGEFLPKLKVGYFEIARVCMSSSTGDVISVRAKRLKRYYKISIVDEYGTKFVEFNDRYSDVPTQGEVLDIIIRMCDDYQSQAYIYSIINENQYQSIEEITNFFFIDSNIYPDLNHIFIIRLKDDGYN